MSTLGDNILDSQELLTNDFKVTFSPYWVRKELLIRRGHITLALILIVILGSITARNYGNSYFLTEEVFFIVFCLPMPFSFILLIDQFRKFRTRGFKEKIEAGRLSRWLVLVGLFFLVAAIAFLISSTAFLFLVYFSVRVGMDGETLGMMILSTPFLLLISFQTFYLLKAMLYLIKYYKLKNDYV